MSESAIISVSDSDYDEQVVAHDGAVLVDCYTPTCPPCRAMAPILDEIARERGDSLKVVKIDVADNSGVAAKLGVRVVPTFVLYSGGEQMDTISGARPKEQFTQWIDETLNLSSD